MATIVASTSNTVVSLLSTIDVTAKAVAQTVGVVASSVDMLDSFVTRAKAQQVKRHKIEDADWTRNLIEDAALERVKRQKEISSQLSATELNALNSAIAEYEALLATEK